MRIILLGPVAPYRGGIAYFTAGLAESLTRSGHEVKILSFRKQYPRLLYPGKSDRDLSAQNRLEDVDYLFSPLSPRDWARSFQAIKAFKPDLVLLQWWVVFWAPAYAWLLKRLKRAKIAVKILVHNTLPHEERFADRLLARWALKDCDSFVLMTAKEEARLQKLLKRPLQTRLAPHPIYRSFPPSGFDKVSLRAQFKLPPEAKVLLFFGFIRAYKGLGDLLDAMNLLRQNGNPAQLLVVGEFWEDPAPYQVKIERLGLQANVHLVNGYIPDAEAGQYFELADLFVAPYRDGTQSGSIKTALGYGLPMVVSEVIADELLRKLPQLCQIVPAEQPVLLAEGIEKAMALPALSVTERDALLYQSWQAMARAVLGEPDDEKDVENEV